MSTVERVGPSFDEARLLAARARSWACLEEAARRIVPGMREEDARALVTGLLVEAGSARPWHPSHVRFGANTLLACNDRSEPGVVLAANDVFFLDLGPVFDGHEGDVGATFVVGDDPEMHRCAEDARAIAHEAAARWREGGATGRDLYQLAAIRARDRGWMLREAGASGHRIGDFPHAAHHRGRLAELDAVPARARWVLEVQLRHPTRPFGAFHEDVLL
jgi:Xaa-Pro aminopeptidase